MQDLIDCCHIRYQCNTIQKRYGKRQIRSKEDNLLLTNDASERKIRAYERQGRLAGGVLRTHGLFFSMNNRRNDHEYSTGIIWMHGV